MKKTVKELVKIFKTVKSVCGNCNGRGKVGLNSCDCCTGKGYHTYDELAEGVECN